MTSAELKRAAEERVWHDTPDSVWDGPYDDSDPSTWAVIISYHRDSDPLEVSNYRVISKDLEERFPDDVEQHHFRHWAVGWIDHLFVRAYDQNGKITPAFKAAMEWLEALQEYPVADEMDLAEVELEMGYEPGEEW